MSGWGHFLNTRAGAITLLIALIVGSACGGGQQPNVTTTESSVTDGGTSSDTSSDTKEGQASSASDSLFFDVPDGRLHAEAWPESEGDRAWRALEIGEGIFVSSEAHGAPWRFVFSSRESSLPVRGLWIEFPPGMDPALRPTAVQLRMSPTPIEITREAWPVVSPLLRSYGVAELPRGGGDGVFIEFDAIERVSLLEIRVLSSVGGRQVGLGRVRLVHQRAREDHADLRSVRLQPLESSSDAPEDTGILGIEGASPLPIPSKK